MTVHVSCVTRDWCERERWRMPAFSLPSGRPRATNWRHTRLEWPLSSVRRPMKLTLIAFIAHCSRCTGEQKPISYSRIRTNRATARSIYYLLPNALLFWRTKLNLLILYYLLIDNINSVVSWRVPGFNQFSFYEFLMDYRSIAIIFVKNIVAVINKISRQRILTLKRGHGFLKPG